MDIVRARQEAKWEEMSAGQKFSDFVRRHEYGVIVGSWAAAMTGAFSYIMRDPCVLYPSMNLGLVLMRRRTASRLFPRRSVLSKHRPGHPTDGCGAGGASPHVGARTYHRDNHRGWHLDPLSTLESI